MSSREQVTLNPEISLETKFFVHSGLKAHALQGNIHKPLRAFIV